jgi:beta-lactam-binding protein with PASTA domain
MRRTFTIVLGALAMVAVALISAFITMRIAIHGREAIVPALTGLSIADATGVAHRSGLSLTLENRFYSAGVAPGRILAQDPAPGSRVRREWPIRITESLGTQAVSIPDLSGESERNATASIRRLSLDLGTVAYLAVPGDPGVVLSQTPTATSGGVDGPRVSLLISDSQDSALTPAYLMPSLLGYTWSGAESRAATAGLHLVLDTAIPDTKIPDTAHSAAQAMPQLSASGTPVVQSFANKGDLIATSPMSASVQPGGIVLAQSPAPGRRVVQGDAVHVTLGIPAPTAGALPSR